MTPPPPPLKPLPALPVVERPLSDSARANLYPVAEMVVACYCHYRLSLEQQGRAAVDAARRERRQWQLQVRVLNEFWLSKQKGKSDGTCQSAALESIGKIVGGDLDDCATLRLFLSRYLKSRGLPDDTAPRVQLQHRMLFAEYFSIHDWQIGNNREFDATLHVLHHADEGDDAAVVGQVLIGGWRREEREVQTSRTASMERSAVVPVGLGQGKGGGEVRDEEDGTRAPSPMMQGIIACPVRLDLEVAPAALMLDLTISTLMLDPLASLGVSYLAPPSFAIRLPLHGLWTTHPIAMEPHPYVSQFYTQHLYHQRTTAPPHTLGVADSILHHLWSLRYSGEEPPFRTLRVHPIQNAPEWRARLVQLPFLRDCAPAPPPQASARVPLQPRAFQLRAVTAACRHSCVPWLTAACQTKRWDGSMLISRLPAGDGALFHERRAALHAQGLVGSDEETDDEDEDEDEDEEEDDDEEEKEEKEETEEKDQDEKESDDEEEEQAQAGDHAATDARPGLGLGLVVTAAASGGVSAAEGTSLSSGAAQPIDISDEISFLSPAERVFGVPELATMCLAHLSSCADLGRAACVCRALALRARCESNVWRALALRWPRVAPGVIPLGTGASPGEGDANGAGEARRGWWTQPCGRKLLRDGVVCCGCGHVACDHCRPVVPVGSSPPAVATTAAAAAAACGTSRTCLICEDVAIGNHSPRWCARCLRHCALCNTRVCSRHMHRDGRCSSCAEDEWSTFGAFSWERGSA